MPAAKKAIFKLFSTFDEVQEDAIVEEIVEEIEEIEELEEIAPTFNQEQLTAAREEGVAVGREQERTEILGAVERQTMNTLASVEKNLGQLLNIQEQANEATHRDGLIIATAVVRRLFPAMNREHARREVEDVITSVMEMVIEEPRVAISVNEKLHADLEKQITAMAAKKGFEGKLTISSDENTPIGDCKIEWGKGSAVRDMDALWREVDAVIERRTVGDAGTPTVPDGKMQENTELDVTDSADSELLEDS